MELAASGGGWRDRQTDRQADR